MCARQSAFYTIFECVKIDVEIAPMFALSFTIAQNSFKYDKNVLVF